MSRSTCMSFFGYDHLHWFCRVDAMADELLDTSVCSSARPPHGIVLVD
jgi:hypothetical protein